MKSARLINTFTFTPKELFRVNKGASVSLRAFAIKPRGKYDLLTVSGRVLPKALDTKGYVAPNGASMRPNSPYQQRFVATTRASNVLIYCVPGGTPLPKDLLLVHERSDHYSLQAAVEMGVQDLNEKITAFLMTWGRALSREEWMRQYPRATEIS